MIVALYDETDAYVTEDENGNEVEEYFNECLADTCFEDFRYEVEETFADRKFPIKLTAHSSNWRGDTGYAIVEDVDDIISKLASFNSTYYKLERGRGGSLTFSLATHDVPTGFQITVKAV